MLTESQYKTFEFIRRFIEKQEYAPTIAENAQWLGVKSHSHIHRNVQAIAEEGLIQLIPNKQRNIHLVDPDEQGRQGELPLKGRIAAGLPIEAIEDRETVNVSELFLGNDRYVLQVVGDSMLGDNICDGDMIVCQSANRARTGDIEVALVDNEETTLKRFKEDKAKGVVHLIPSNTTFAEMIYESHRVQIQGIYLGLIRIAY